MRQIITTTDSIEGYRIKEYVEVINANIVIGTNILSDIVASFTDFFGGKSSAYQSKMDSMFDKVRESMASKAESIGANAIVGFRVDFEEISGKGKGMLMINATGTACRIEPTL